VGLEGRAGTRRLGHVGRDLDPVGDRQSGVLAHLVQGPHQLPRRSLDPEGLVDVEVEGQRPRPLAGQGEVGVPVGPELEVLTGQALAGDLH